MHNVRNFQVTVEKAKLLDTLRANRAEHESIYKEACETFKQKCIDLLSERVKAIRSGDLKPNQYLANNLSTPVSYLTVYDQVIGMLEMSQDSSITINGEQYSNWVKDQWNWSRQFADSNSRYSAKAEMLSASFN